MLRHYVTHIPPNGFKAQVVAYSRAGGGALPGRLHRRARRAAGRGCNAEPRGQGPDDGRCASARRPWQARIQAWRYRQVLAAVEFAPIISGSNNDDPAWKVWTDPAAQEQRIKRFKKPLLGPDAGKTDPTGLPDRGSPCC